MNTIKNDLWIGVDVGSTTVKIAVVDPTTTKLLHYSYQRHNAMQAKKVRAKNSKAEVLNGIAYDGKDFWITGKYWPVMYKIRLKK